MMEFSLFLHLTIILMITSFCRCLEQASFYGNSFISIPLKEAKGYTDIHFKFRTNLPNALILLVAGTTDYCILRLDDAKLKLNINLGSGEFEIVSPSSLKLNDLHWHEIKVTRKEANLSLIIDNVHSVNKKLPGKFFELNVHYGLFVGGHGNYSDMFFGHQENFRGCLADLVYNGISVLEHARHRQTQTTIVKGVTWNCAAEFDADSSQPISFISDNSFMTISTSSAHDFMTWQFELKTASEKSAIVLYRTGLPLKSDTFSLELWKGKLKVAFKVGDKVFDGTNDIFIADGQWHKVSVRIASSVIELNVDSWSKNVKIAKSAVYSSEANNILYVGGVDLNKRLRIASKGLKIPEGNFKGCIKHLKVADKYVGLQDAHISENLLNGCVWKFPCLTKNPCNSDDICIQQNLDSYQCICKLGTCGNATVSKNDKVISRGSLATDLELLILEPLHVVEGQSTLITTNNLHVVLDYPKYGITELGVIFHIMEGPEHGHVAIDVWPHEKNSFTLADISRDKVYYVHDGLEHSADRIVMEVEFSTTDVFILPAYLQGRFRLTLMANITPVNDPPVLNIPATAVLRLARGSRRIINRDLLHAKDPDSSPKQLVYSIIDSGSGHLEYVQKSGAPISSFTQQEINNEHVAFVHHSTAPDDSYLSLKVSDGIEISKSAKLRISAFPHYWRIHNNTGIVVMHENAVLITSFNLSFISNVPGAIDEAQYFIIQEPQFGIVETELNEKMWEKAISFTSEDLRRHRVRYRHTTARPNYDEFQFRTTLNGSSTYIFRITFQKCNLVKLNSETLEMQEIQQSVITERQLLYKTEPIMASSTLILFVIIRTPQYGYLFSSDSKYRIGVDDTFTQEDINAQNINYKLFHKSYSYISDSFSYIAKTKGCNNITGNVTIEYFPSEQTSSKVHVILQRLQVQEGGKINIAPTHLSITSALVAELLFNVTDGPFHGFLQVKEENFFRNKTNFFTSQELVSNRLFYIHDDSESRQDSFHFVALSDTNYEGFQYTAVFHIDILLKNDNGPVRSIEKVFHVVAGGQRLLTGKDLKYSDADINTTPSDIMYTCRDLPNGQIYSSKNSAVNISEFSQKDLDNGNIIFKHFGSKHGKIKLWVTDGQFYVDGILEVQASAPFIRINNGKKLITQHGKWAVISSEHLSVETNLFATDNDIIYEITTKPSYGKVINSQNLQEVTNFTQTHINNGQIFYTHKNQDNTIGVDQVHLRVRCKDAINVTQLNIWMLPASYWDPLIVKNLRTLLVEESTSAIIDNTILEISQADDIPADAIVYSIYEYPQNGYFSFVPEGNNNNNDTRISSFTQALVNEKKLVYVQSKSNETRDSIAFNVTNGMVWLHGLFLNIDIIPENLYLDTNGLNISEGGSAILTETQIFICTDYYKTKVIEYIILQQPLYGWIENKKSSNKLSSFTHTDFIGRNVQYVHDNSENLLDELVIVAVADTKRSKPLTIPINILPINDQYPQLVNNTGLTMWEGGVSIITNNMLAAADSDHPPNILRYQVLGCWWGNVSLISEPKTSLRFFTQELINKGVVVFRHQNGSDAKFTFNISDGLHSTNEYSFQIKTKPVVIQLLEQSTLHVFPLQKKVLTSAHLLVSVSDPNRSIQYKIISSPVLGRLLARSDSKDSVFKMTSKFTQADINDGRIFYEHTHPFEDLYAEDLFIFNVESHLAQPLINQKFKIDISISSGGLDRYITIPKITVDEGGITSIKLNISGVVSFLESHAGLKSPVLHASIIMNSLHGQVFLQKFPNLTTFTQQQLETGQVYYQHDHSDSLEDYIYFSLYLLPGYIILCNITVPIGIIPINDQPFKLITPAPHFTVVQGENHTITSQELSTEDADTNAADIHYDIISGPSKGRLILLPDATSVSHFSQEDINVGRLIYVHGGQFLTDVFHLRVWDGKFRPDFTVLNIQVVPISLNVSVDLPLYLQQGSNVVLLSRKQFIIQTNANIDKIKYAVKEGPNHGLLYVKDAPATIFGQTELDNDDVMYMQTDMTTANDSVKIFVNLMSGNTSIGEEVEVVIKVQPLMQIKNFTAVSGANNRLTVNVLDATPLAKLTNSNPHYTIIHSSHYGQIRKIIRSSGEKRNVFDAAVNSFTHEEVQSGLIYLVVKNVDVGWEGLRDELHFILAATIFQPAVGKLKIIIKSTLHEDIYSTLASPNDPAGREGGMHMASPNMTRDYFLIVSMVVGVIVLGVTVIVIIKCRTLEPDLNKEEQSLQPIPLPRPPEALMATPSPIKQHVHDGFTSPVSTTLPQCKVTPLNEAHTRYPYGIEEHLDDWSSCDASDPSCPTRNNIMLRRNQYWV